MIKRVTVRAQDKIEAVVLNGRAKILCADKGEPLTLLGKDRNSGKFIVSVQDRSRPLVFQAERYELQF